jgi:hypothetical protein
MLDCMNHPGVPATGACARCGQPYCDNCLVEFLGARYCGPCRNLRLAETQGPAYAANSPGFVQDQAIFAGTGRVDVSRWLGKGWELTAADIGTWLLAALVATLLGIVSCGIAFPALVSGMFLMAFHQIRGERVTLDQLFSGFSRFLNSLGLALIAGLPMVILLGLAIGNLVRALSMSKPDSSDAVSAILFFYAIYPIAMLVAVVFYTVAFFAYPRVAATNASPLAAISDSWQVVRRNPWMFLAMVFLLGLIHFAGSYFCQLLMLFVFPLMVLTVAQAYVDHFGLLDADLR